MSGVRLQVFGRGGEQRHAQTVALRSLELKKYFPVISRRSAGLLPLHLIRIKRDGGLGTGTYVSGFKQVANRLARGTFIIEPGCCTVCQTDPSVAQTVW
jgi:hypothetical protein